MRLFIVILSGLLLAGCAHTSYQPGRSAADVPAKVDVIKLDRIVPAEVLSSVERVDQNVETDPSTGDLEAVAVAKAAVVDQFRNFGFKVVEDDSRKADLLARVYVVYQPEYGLLARAARVHVHMFDPGGTHLFDTWETSSNGGGLLIRAAIGQSKDEMLTAVARAAVQKAVAVIQTGTKAAVAKAAAAAPAP